MKFVAAFFIVSVAVMLIHHVEGKIQNGDSYRRNERKDSEVDNKNGKNDIKGKCGGKLTHDNDDQVNCLCKDTCNTDGTDQEYIDINEECSGNNTCCKPCYSTCGGSFTGPTGSFTSPNYPSNYCNNQDCYYNITVEDGYGIIFNFTTFHLDDLNGMNPDFVKAYNGEIAESIGTFKITGGPYPLPLESEFSDNPSSNIVIVHFSSGETQTNPGFQVTYKIIR